MSVGIETIKSERDEGGTRKRAEGRLDKEKSGPALVQPFGFTI